MEINYPLEKTYFIVYNNEKTVVKYGEISPEQCMSSGLENIYKTTSFQDYKIALSMFNIQID